MNTSMPIEVLGNYVCRLLSSHIPDGYDAPYPLDRYLVLALDRLEHCFSRIKKKYYHQEGVTQFNHLNADHMAAFLYFFGNTVWQETGDTGLPTRLYYLNKIMHGLDLFFSIRMPDIFLLVHPVGTVLGNATYGDYLVVYQNCTVGALTNIYPSFGIGTILYSRSSVLGNCKIGNNVVFAANCQIIDTDVLNDTVVLGQFPSLRFRDNEVPVLNRCF